MAAALSLHLLAAVLWVGGMLLMLVVVRPAAIALLEPPLRIRFLHYTLGRFFAIVWAAILVILASGFWMLFSVYGGLTTVAWPIHLMFALGNLMVVVFLVIYFIPFRKLTVFVAAENWPQAGAQLEPIRKLVTVNAALGVIIILSASGGRFL